eukprot:scaffold39225_cov60-Phaeocystis_antarctica.AAC.2
MWKTRVLRPRPAGSPEAPFSARSCLRLPRASASLGQSAAWVALTGHIGLVFHIGAKSESMLPDNYLGRSFGAHWVRVLTGSLLRRGQLARTLGLGLGLGIVLPPSSERRSSPPLPYCTAWGGLGWARLAPGGAPHSGAAALPGRPGPKARPRHGDTRLRPNCAGAEARHHHACAAPNSAVECVWWSPLYM